MLRGLPAIVACASGMWGAQSVACSSSHSTLCAFQAMPLARLPSVPDSPSEDDSGSASSGKTSWWKLQKAKVPTVCHCPKTPHCLLVYALGPLTAAHLAAMLKLAH